VVADQVDEAFFLQVGRRLLVGDLGPLDQSVRAERERLADLALDVGLAAVEDPVGVAVGERLDGRFGS
jgi:hypothetical protein